MKIVIAGYGKMGHEIERIALERGHTIAGFYNSSTNWETAILPECDAVIDFSTPDTAPVIVNRCFELNIPVISGTTGWNDKVLLAREKAFRESKTFFYASNFSIGVNILFEVNRKLASFLCNLHDYEVSINETHHVHKKDAPSGTAITIAEGIIKACKRYESWMLYDITADTESSHETMGVKDTEQQVKPVITISSERIGEVPGTHCIKWESKVDTIELKHTAHSRTGFAYGAVYAAEFIMGKTGVFGMSDLLQLGE